MTEFHIGDIVKVVKEPSYTTGWLGKVVTVDQVDETCFNLVKLQVDWDWQDPTMWYRDDEIRKL